MYFSCELPTCKEMLCLKAGIAICINVVTSDAVIIEACAGEMALL